MGGNGEHREYAVEVIKMFEAAKTMPKGDWQAYSDCKAMFENIPLTNYEYERIIQKLVDILEV